MAQTTTILGISLGTRSLGLVILKNNIILDWQVKMYKESWSKQKPEMIIREINTLIHLYHITHVALKIPHTVPTTSTSMQVLLDAINALLQREQLKSSVYALYELKQSFQDIPINNKRELMYCLTKRFPCMYSQYKKELKNRNPYYIKMFEALCAANYCYTQLSCYP